MQNISFQNIEMIFQPNISETALINIDSNFLQLQVTFKYIMKYKLYLFQDCLITLINVIYQINSFLSSNEAIVVINNLILNENNPAFSDSLIQISNGTLNFSSFEQSDNTFMSIIKSFWSNIAIINISFSNMVFLGNNFPIFLLIGGNFSLIIFQNVSFYEVHI